MEELPKETCEDRFRDAVEDLQRPGVRPEESEDNDDGGKDNEKREEGEE